MRGILLSYIPGHGINLFHGHVTVRHVTVD